TPQDKDVHLVLDNYSICIFELQGCTSRSVMSNCDAGRMRARPVCNVHSGADESESLRIDQMLCLVEEGAVRVRPPASHPPDCNVESLMVADSLRHRSVMCTYLLTECIEQGLRRGAGPGLDRTRKHTVDHGVRQSDECQEGR